MAKKVDDNVVTVKHPEYGTVQFINPSIRQKEVLDLYTKMLQANDPDKARRKSFAIAKKKALRNGVDIKVPIVTVKHYTGEYMPNITT